MFRLALLLLLVAGCSRAQPPTSVPAPAAALPAAPEGYPAVAPEALAPAGYPGADGDAASPAEGTRRFVLVPEASKVTYEVGEVLIREGNRYNLAVGTTTKVSGEVLVNLADPTQSTVGPIQVDISAFVSDSQRRDQAIRDRWLESARFPLATFKPTQIDGPTGLYADGTQIAGQITGDLTVRDVTKPVTFDVSGRIVGGEMTGTATTALKMSDFGFPAPDILGMIKAEDDVRITFDFVARSQ